MNKDQIDVTMQISKYIIDYLEKNKPDEHAVIIALIGVYFGSVEAVVRDYRKNGLSESDIRIFIDTSLKLLEESKQIMSLRLCFIVSFFTITNKAYVFICTYSIIESIVYFLELLPKVSNILSYNTRILFFYNHSFYEICNLFHLAFFHAQSSCFRNTYSNSAWMHVVPTCLNISW